MCKRSTILLALLLFWPSKSLAIDIIKIERPLSSADKRALYKNTLLRAVLDASRGRFGQYRLEEAPRVLSSPERAKLEIVSGEFINTYITSTTVAWEAAAIPIRFPIRKGISGYRLLLAHKDEVEKFRGVLSKDDLRAFTSGTIGIGSLAQALISQKFKVVKSPTFDSAFYMLAAKRFDFISRGVNEVHRELESGLPAFNDIQIVPGIALYLPIATYIFVSPKYPRLAERFSHGLKIIANNGEFERIFEKFHGESLRVSSLSDRHIIKLDNPNIPSSVTFDYKDHWLDDAAL